MNNEVGSRAIVVGIDGTALSRDALVFALEEGLARHATVKLVTAWMFGSTSHDAPPQDTFELESARTHQLLADSLAEVSASFEVLPTIVQIVDHGESGAVLVEASRDAAMLVVGSGRKGPLTRTFLGSVSEHCVRHALVPVVVVPDAACLYLEDVAGPEAVSVVSP